MPGKFLLAGEAGEAGDDKRIGPGTAVVGVWLPMGKARAAAKAEALRASLASALGLPEAAVELVPGPSGETVASRVQAFCAHTGSFALRRQLEGLSLGDLRARAGEERVLPPAELEGLGAGSLRGGRTRPPVGGARSVLLYYTLLH